MSKYKNYKFANHTFEIHGPRGDTITVKSKDLPDGKISPHEPTGKFRASVLGCGKQYTRVENAFKAVFHHMILAANQKDKDTLREEMYQYFDRLSDGRTCG